MIHEGKKLPETVMVFTCLQPSLSAKMGQQALGQLFKLRTRSREQMLSRLHLSKRRKDHKVYPYSLKKGVK